MPVDETDGRAVYLGVLVNRNNFSRFIHLAKIHSEISGANIGGLKPVLYFFMLQDIDMNSLTVRGFYYDGASNCWSSRVFPFPDVIYLRKMPDLLDHGANAFLMLAQEMNIPLVNARPTFDKWEVYQVLSTFAELRPHLPHTRLCRKPGNDITVMLRKYGGVYLKACRGSRGKEVLRVSSRPGGGVEYSYFDGKLFTGRVEEKSLPRVAHNFFGDQPFIIQQPIDLIDLGGSKVDLRAEVQRNGKGELEVVGVPVRVGGHRSPITTHASSYRFTEFFSEVMHFSAAAVEELQNRLYHLLVKIYEAMESSFGSFGELGIDLGLDTGNRLWFIECNSQSAKVSLMNAYDGPTLRRAFSNPLEYAYSIAASRH